MTAENGSSRAPSRWISELLDAVGDLLLFLVLFLVGLQLLWGVVVGEWLQTAITFWFEIVRQWPAWLYWTVGLLILLSVFVVPVAFLSHWMVDEENGLLARLVALRKAVGLQGLLEPVRKAIYCLAVFSVLRAVWADYGKLDADPELWLGMLRKVASVLLG